MKKIILLLSVFGLNAAVAQSNTPDDPDTTKLNLPNMTIIFVENGDSMDVEIDEEPGGEYICEDEPEDFAKWAGIGFGINGFMNSKQSIGLGGNEAPFEVDYSKSLNVQLNMFQHRFKLGTNHLGLTTGLGIEFARYGFRNTGTLTSNSDSTWMVPDSNNYRKNFLKTTYLQAPLLLEINTSKNPGQGLYVAAGVVAGYRIGTKTKQKRDFESGENKLVVKDDFNVNPFRVSATARIGFNDIVLYANYGLTQLFESNKGPELYPLSCGIQLAF